VRLHLSRRRRLAARYVPLQAFRLPGQSGADRNVFHQILHEYRRCAAEHVKEIAKQAAGEV
jgi:hypothetical protein